MSITDKIKNNKKLIYITLWLLLFVFAILFFSIGIENERLWRNEGCTYAMTNNTFKDIIKISQYDYNPPLYFIMIKLFSMLFGNTIISLRIFSVLGTIALLCLSIGPVRRILGKTGSLIYMLLIIILPVFSSVSQDAQLYSWACFFVTAAVLYGYLILTKNKLFDWFKFGFFVLASCYIHHYALIAVAFLNIFMFVFILIKAKNKIIPFIIMDIILIILFLPWVSSLFYQMAQVIKRYWILKPNYFIIMQSLTYQFGSKFAGSINYAGFALFSILLYYAFRISFLEKTKQSILFLLSLAVYTSTFLFVFFFSKIIKPVLHPAYFFNVTGMLVIIAAYTLSRLKEIKSTAIVLLFLIIITLPAIISVRTVRYNEPINEAVIYLQLNIKEGDVILHSDDQTAFSFAYYFPNNYQYLDLPYYFKGYSNYEAFKNNLTVSYDVNRFLKESKNIWIVSKNENSIPFNFYKSIIYTDKYKLTDNPEPFINRNSWMIIDLFKYEKIKQ